MRITLVVAFEKQMAEITFYLEIFLCKAHADRVRQRNHAEKISPNMSNATRTYSFIVNPQIFLTRSIAHDMTYSLGKR